MKYEIKCVENKAELSEVLELCYDILGQGTANHELYCREAWEKRLDEFGKLMVYATGGGRVISLVLGRPENEESLVCGCVACHSDYRRQGITRQLMSRFEENAREMGFKYITLGADDGAVGFYEKCGYQQIMEIHGQKIFQKVLQGEEMQEKICEKVQLIDNILRAEDFVRLRVEAGFAEVPIEHARLALQNGLINVSAIYAGELVGMGRLVGDGAMYWYLQEIIVLPKYQKQGIGTRIVNHLVDYAVANSQTGTFTTIGGVSAKDKEPFYEKLGFDIIPNGMKKMIEI